MLLTKDNLIKFIREKKAVLPSQIAEEFETTTTIASATLSELSKEKKVLITDLKLSSSPFYYDPNQKEILEKIGEEYLSNYSKEAFLKLKKYKLLPKNFFINSRKLSNKKIN